MRDLRDMPETDQRADSHQTSIARSERWTQHKTRNSHLASRVLIEPTEPIADVFVHDLLTCSMAFAGALPYVPASSISLLLWRETI